MNVEEIKEHTSMRDVLSQYGIQPNRSGMCSCPWHKDKHPSMKIYPDGFKCFSCNRNGDIFKFVQYMENCDFKTAFIHLGGSYGQHKNEVSKRLIQAKFDRSKKQKEKVKDAESEFRKMLQQAIKDCNQIIATHLLFSDSWCKAQNLLPWLEHVSDEKYIQEEGVNEIDVIRVCREIGCIVNSIK